MGGPIRFPTCVSPRQKLLAGLNHTGFPAEEIVEDLIRYFEKERSATIGEVEERGTSRRYIFIQVIKYLNLLNFYYKKGQLDHFPHKNLGANKFKAIGFLAIYLSIIEKRSVTWISNNLLRRWGEVFNIEFGKKLISLKALSISSILENYPVLERLSIKHAHPLFFVEKLSELLPEAELEDLLKAHNSQRYLYLRIMKNSIDPARVRGYFRQARVPLKKVQGIDSAFQFLRRNIKKVVRSPLYLKCDISLHDRASMEACIMLDPKPRERILDACAAPLMKTSLLQRLSLQQSEIVSVDVSLSRLTHSKNLTIDHAGISLINADVTMLPFRGQGLGEQFDKVLLDAPCTSSGAIYYSPEAKWLQTPEYLHSHEVLQKKLVQECLRHIRPGGMLVYAVCSYYREEGEDVIASIVDQTKIIHTRRFFPHVDKCQGFFIAILKEESNR